MPLPCPSYVSSTLVFINLTVFINLRLFLEKVYFTSQRNLKVNSGINQRVFLHSFFLKNETSTLFPIPLINDRNNRLKFYSVIIFNTIFIS